MASDTPNEYERFRKTFFEECAEILADLEGRLEQLQAGGTGADDLNAIFRAVHSIKAGAGAFNYVRLVEFTHVFENLLDQLRDGRIAPDDRVIATLIRAGDILSALVAAAQEDEVVEDDFGSDAADELQSILDRASPGGGQKASPAANEKAAAATPAAASAPVSPAAGGDGDGRALYRIVFRPHAELFRHANEPLFIVRELKQLGELTAVCDTGRVPRLTEIDPEEAYLAWTFELASDQPKAKVLEAFEFVDHDCDLEVEELRQASPQAAAGEQAPPAEAREAAEESDRAAPAAEKGATGDKEQKGKRAAVSSIRVDISRIDRLVNMAGELVIAQAMLAQQIEDNGIQNGQAPIHGHEDLATLTRELQECVMAIRMQPVKSVFARMPRLVRDIAGKLGKSVRLITSGEHTEVDKTVIEELADPLTHIIRNAVDHGVEAPALRAERGKPEEGLIQLSAAHVGSNILIHITDDGAGINRERLLQKAISRGIVSPDAVLSAEEIEDLIFAPGLSTAETITDVSGRGVGMDVVRRNITNLGGRIQVQSTPGKGTRFTLVIPLTLAVLDGMAIAVGSQRYIMPLTSIVESFRPSQRQIRSLTDGRQLTSVRGEFFRVLHLDRLFNVPGAIADPWDGLVVLVETAGGQKVGIKVDELLGQQQVVIKSLQENFCPIPGISGATILGNGSVALILDIEELAKMTERQFRSAEPADDGERPFPARQPVPSAEPAATQHALSA